MPRRRRVSDSEGEEEDEPGPSTSSRHRRRQRSEDHESADEAILTQYKAENQGAKRRQIGEVEIEEAAEPKPLSLNASETVIKKLATDYSTSAQNVKEAAELLVDAAERITEFSGFAETDGSLHEDVQPLEEHTRDLVDAQAEIEARKHALDKIRADLAAGTEILDAPQRYEALVKEEMDKFKAKTSRQRYAHNKLYEHFRQKVWDAATEEAMPPIADFIPEEDGDGEGSDDEIEAGAAKIDYKCPLTMRIFEDPVSSTVCRHSFERAAITDYFLAQRSARVKCPGAGCSAFLAKTTLKDNRAFATDVKNYKRRQQRREEQKRTQQAASTLVD